jgi:hypothetical protein
MDLLISILLLISTTLFLIARISFYVISFVDISCLDLHIINLLYQAHSSFKFSDISNNCVIPKYDLDDCFVSSVIFCLSFLNAL